MRYARWAVTLLVLSWFCSALQAQQAVGRPPLEIGAGPLLGIFNLQKEPSLLGGVAVSARNNFALGLTMQIGKPRFGHLGIDWIPSKLELASMQPVEVRANLKRRELKFTYRREFQFKHGWPKLLLGGGLLARSEDIKGKLRYSNSLNPVSHFEIPVVESRGRFGVIGAAGYKIEAGSVELPLIAEYARVFGDCSVLERVRPLPVTVNSCVANELKITMKVVSPLPAAVSRGITVLHNFKLLLGTVFQ